MKNAAIERLKTNIAPLRSKLEPLTTRFRPREKFLVLEVTPHGTSGLFVGVDAEKNLFIEKLSPDINVKKIAGSPARKLRRVVAVADPALATTIPVPLELARESTASEIGLAELENLIALAMGKIFNQCRSEAAKRFSADELDTILVSAKARHFKVDGHLVVNPIGFHGKKVALVLELTFTTREMSELFKDFFNAPEEFFFAEAPQIRLMSLARGKKLPLNLITADHGRAALYVLDKPKEEYPVLYREPLAWNFESLFQTIASALGVSSVTARALYRMYERQTLSETAARAFKRILDPAMEAFFAEIEKGKLRGSVYIDAPERLPFAMPYRYGSLLFEELNIEEMLRALGFTPHIEMHGAEQAVARHIYPFLEAYFAKPSSEINQKLRRRLHWLAE